MKTHLLLSFSVLLAAVGPAWSVGPPARPGTPSEAVVLVTATLRPPNAIRPWAPTKSQEASGSGVVIAGNKILTNAHVVSHATEVHVQTGPGADKFEARVESIGPAVDLAVLTVSDKKFFEKRMPLARDKKMPQTRDTVEVYGFPIGGAEMSVTKGVVSRIGFTNSLGSPGMFIQVSAAVNPGNSGGPAVVDGKMIGLVNSKLRGGENIGYVIPNEEIDIFLEDVKDGRYKGKPRDATSTQYQTLENESLRSMLKVDKAIRGVLAVPPRRAEAGNPFQEFDIITRIGDHDIDNSGMVRLPNGLRIPFSGMIARVARNNMVPLSVLRKGKRLQLLLPVTTSDNRVIRGVQGEQPSYFIHGPLAFSAATLDHVVIFGFQTNPSLLTRRLVRARFPGEQLVVVTAPIFEHKIAKGYGDPVGQTVEEINGQKVKSLRHLVEILRDSKDEFLKFRFAEEGTEILVFRRTLMNKATEEVLDDAGIAVSRRGSKDMLKVWNNGVAPRRTSGAKKD